MKKITPAVILYLLFICNNSLIAQNFLNGSLEPGSGAVITNCADNLPWNINSMGGVHTSVVGYPLVYVSNSTCGLGAAADGSYFLGLHYRKASSPSGTQLLVEMNTPMTIGTTYNFSFYYKGPPLSFGTGADLSYGYALDTSSLSDSTVGTISRPSDASWTKVTKSLTPKTASRYIWVQAYSSSSTDTANITYVDEFYISPADVPNLEKKSMIHLYPNPASNVTELQLDDAIALPYSYIVVDITGRPVMEKQEINSKSTTINANSLSKGIYFLHITDKEKNSYITKFIKQ